MKRLYTVGLSLVLFVVVTGARDAEAQVKFGIWGGLNYASLEDVEVNERRTSYENRSGYNFGVFIDMASGGFAFRPGVGYLNTGPLFEEGLRDFVSDVVDTFELNYIFVPIDVRLRLGIPIIRPYVHFGPELRFRTESGDLDPEVEDNLRSFNVAGNVGGGLELGLGSIRLMPEVRFAFDLSGIAGDTWMIRGVELIADDEYKATSVTLRLGIAF